MERILLDINGNKVEASVESNWTMLYVLREVLNFTGTKCGCGTNDCGSCKIIVDGEAVNSCAINACKAVGKKITTIEGLAQGEKLHPIQQAFIEVGAVQCGFCTPGMIMTTKAFLDKKPDPTEQEARASIDKNMCRCTGYVKIVDAILLAAKRMQTAK